MRQLKISKSITKREAHSLEKYLQEIGKVGLMKPNEEVALAVLIKLGDQNAFEKLVKANLRFVVSVAKQYQNQIRLRRARSANDEAPVVRNHAVGVTFIMGISIIRKGVSVQYAE